ncbi:four-carbon acid sugar kinase family protein [Vagococcus sp.]|uniref:four-carbon acid sugar kinase family protein n=1 Tax=Vagococcus sp. TaxID=1933889 RepID=UPI003F988070
MDGNNEINSLNQSEIDDLYHEKAAAFNGKIIVLDDDPTGTQTVHDVVVYTDWTKDSLYEAFKKEDKMFYILTNSRSFSEEKTKNVHQEIAKTIAEVSLELGISFTIISRGDSTLRGHYPLETEVLKETLEKEMFTTIDGEILCFSFFEGGRYTLDNVHYLKKENQSIPVGETEFAKDQTFGFISSNLIDYIVEKSQQTIEKTDILSISIDDLRHKQVALIEKKLMTCHKFQKVVVNATNYEELRVFVIALLGAIEKGKKFIFRTAASLPKVLADISTIDYLPKEAIIAKDNINGGLIIVGSHVKLSTLQLNQLKESTLDLTFIEFNVASYLEKKTYDDEISRVNKVVEKQIRNGKSVVIYTSRDLLIPKSVDKELVLAMSVEVSVALTKIIQSLVSQPKYIISKGGITSSDIATKGLGIKEALVLGQADAGIPVWLSDKKSKFSQMPYLIFPGNVGTTNTLRDVVEKLEGYSK